MVKKGTGPEKPDVWTGFNKLNKIGEWMKGWLEKKMTLEIHSSLNSPKNILIVLATVNCNIYVGLITQYLILAQYYPYS